MPLYLTGSQDGSVQMWEWGHQQSVCTPRPSGTFAKGKNIIERTGAEKKMGNSEFSTCFMHYSLTLWIICIWQWRDVGSHSMEINSVLLTAMENWAYGRLDSHRNQIARSLWVYPILQEFWSFVWVDMCDVLNEMRRKKNILTLFFHLIYSSSMPYQHQNHECHNKLLADFMFIGSCSLVATGTLNAQFSFMSINFTHTHMIPNLFTAGHSSESKNVAMWDTLLPQKKSMIACKFQHRLLLSDESYH